MIPVTVLLAKAATNVSNIYRLVFTGLMLYELVKFRVKRRNSNVEVLHDRAHERRWG